MIAIEPAPSKSSPVGAAIRRRELSRFLSSAIKAVGLSGKVSVLLTGDDRVRAMNHEFRGHDHATDVLSFPVPAPFADSGHAGDLAISLDTASCQAAGFGHSLQTEVKVLILHGLLHLAGEDHETDSGKMARRERRLRKELDLPLGLIERGQPAVKTRPGGRAEKQSAGKARPAPRGQRNQNSRSGRK